jgi:putative SOS response-associated peptidase YedK
MCFHYDAAHSNNAKKRFSFIKESPDYKPLAQANAFTFPAMPVVASNKTSHIQLFQWGLIPHWATPDKAPDLRKSTLNAKAETLFELPSFKDATSTRCLVLAERFYEWRHEGNNKIQYNISLKDQEVFAMGGIYTVWKEPKTGEKRSTFAIVTVPANEMMAYIHNSKQRMPLILPPGKELEWLQPDLSQQQLNFLMRPYRNTDMLATRQMQAGQQFSLF